MTTRKMAGTIKSIAKIKTQIDQKESRAKKLRSEFENVKQIVKNLFFYQKPYTVPTPSIPEKYILTENLNYFTTGNESIWGSGDLDTLNYLNSLSLSLSKSELAQCLRWRWPV